MSQPWKKKTQSLRSTRLEPGQFQNVPTRREGGFAVMTCLRTQVVDFDSSSGLTRAFALASRWQKQNLGRSAGFDRLGAGVLSGFKHTNPILMRQLQGLNVLTNWQSDQRQSSVFSDEAFAQFIADVEASEFTAREFRAVAPVGREALCL